MESFVANPKQIKRITFMVKKIKNNRQPQTPNYPRVRVNRYLKFLGIIAVSLLLMGCWLAELWEDMSDASFWEYDAQITGEGKPTSEVLEPSTPIQAAPLQEPVYQPEASQGSDETPSNSGINEYSVSAQDFNCICQVSGNVSVELRVNGDQLEIIDPGGNAEVFDKIGENTFKRSWMGYYIDTTGGKETKVDEEHSVVIILTNNGYMMEHYKGSEISPCCIYTFTKAN